MSPEDEGLRAGGSVSLILLPELESQALGGGGWVLGVISWKIQLWLLQLLSETILGLKDGCTPSPNMFSETGACCSGPVTL